MDRRELYEGGSGEAEIHTERGLTTENNLATNRNMIDKPEDVLETYAERVQREARLRLLLEDSVTLNKRYATVFSGLKLNTPRNSAVTHPLAYMLRRVLYSVAIVFMGHVPTLATLFVLGLCLAMTILTIVEKQWIDPEIQKLALANEVLLYMVLMLAIGSSLHLSTTDAEATGFGWAMIVIVTLAIHMNVIYMMTKALQHVKLLYRRRENKKVFLNKRKQVAPVQAEASKNDFSNAHEASQKAPVEEVI